MREVEEAGKSEKINVVAGSKTQNMRAGVHIVMSGLEGFTEDQSTST